MAVLPLLRTQTALSGMTITLLTLSVAPTPIIPTILTIPTVTAITVITAVRVRARWALGAPVLTWH